jgi:predicted membrane-bound dolichyl-phosphate-mannose-protein mannosyltransferase
MSDRIRELLSQITVLEEELRTALHDQEHRVVFQIKGKRIEFENTVRDAHRRLKTGFFRWLVADRPLNLITGPIIYSMIVPLLMLDLCVSFYQLACFPIYRVAKVRRGDYIVFDHQHLAYLNFFEKFHCLYCSYAVGLLAFITEIVARTEQYFCPIKHAHKVLGSHARYPRFLDYGDAADYAARLEEFRRALEEKKS